MNTTLIAPAHPVPFTLLASAVAYLLARLDRVGASDDVWSTVRHMLEALPLTTNEYGRARNHLANAACYLAAGERGAARYELNSLLRRLTAILGETVAQPIGL